MSGQTSLAFMLGVAPLAISTGAGSGGQNAIGTGVPGGMLSATVLAILLVPVFFVVVLRLFRVKRLDHEKRGRVAVYQPAVGEWWAWSPSPMPLACRVREGSGWLLADPRLPPPAATRRRHLSDRWCLRGREPVAGAVGAISRCHRAGGISLLIRDCNRSTTGICGSRRWTLRRHRRNTVCPLWPIPADQRQRHRWAWFADLGFDKHQFHRDPKKTIYQIFAAKSELFDALLTEWFAPFTILVEADGHQPCEVLTGLLYRLVNFILSERQISMTRLLVAETPHSDDIGLALEWQGIERCKGA
jgi:AcrB/AcrD/AcrF family